MLHPDARISATMQVKIQSHPGVRWTVSCCALNKRDGRSLTGVVRGGWRPGPRRGLDDHDAQAKAGDCSVALSQQADDQILINFWERFQESTAWTSAPRMNLGTWQCSARPTIGTGSYGLLTNAGKRSALVQGCHPLRGSRSRFLRQLRLWARRLPGTEPEARILTGPGDHGRLALALL